MRRLRPLFAAWHAEIVARYALGGGAHDGRAAEMGVPRPDAGRNEPAASRAEAAFAGCANARTVRMLFGNTIVRCLKGKPYGKKCKQYEVEDE